MESHFAQEVDILAADIYRGVGLLTKQSILLGNSNI